MAAIDQLKSVIEGNGGNWQQFVEDNLDDVVQLDVFAHSPAIAGAIVDHLQEFIPLATAQGLSSSFVAALPTYISQGNSGPVLAGTLNALLTSKGGIAVGNGAGQVNQVAPGANGLYPVSDLTNPNGVRWDSAPESQSVLDAEALDLGGYYDTLITFSL